MSIVTRAAPRSSQLRRSGMCPVCPDSEFRGPKSCSCRSYGAGMGIRGGRCYKHGAPNGASRPAEGANEPLIGATEPLIRANEPLIGATKPLIGATEPLIGATEPLIGATEPLIGASVT